MSVRHSSVRLIIGCLLLAGLALPAGCSSTEDSPSACPPGWFLNHPLSDDYSYGVGFCGKTYIPNTSKEIAMARAVKELAEQAGIYIKSESLLVQKMRGNVYIEQWSQEINTRVEGIIRGFEIVEEHHCFEAGDHTFPGGTTMILVRIPRDRLKSED
jgi:hypothetical protein